MTPEQTIRHALAAFGYPDGAYILLRSHGGSSPWVLKMPGQAPIHASCARTMIRAVRRRMNRVVVAKKKP